MNFKFECTSEKIEDIKIGCTLGLGFELVETAVTVCPTHVMAPRTVAFFKPPY